MICVIKGKVFERTYSFGSRLFRLDYTSRNSLAVGPSNLKLVEFADRAR